MGVIRSSGLLTQAIEFLKRAGQPEDIAAVCSFLASPAAGYVTGQTFGVNGGRVIV